MRTILSTALTEPVRAARLRLPHRRPRLHGARAGAGGRRARASSTPASPSRTWSRSPPGWRAAGCGPGSTASRRFVYARPFEQIRNDVCLHDLPVKLVGNGGGYGYGVMGATHHALEDYGALTALAAPDRLRAGVRRGRRRRRSRASPPSNRPAYLRLGRDEKPKGLHAAGLRALAARPGGRRADHGHRRAAGGRHHRSAAALARGVAPRGLGASASCRSTARRCRPAFLDDLRAQRAPLRRRGARGARGRGADARLRAGAARAACRARFTHRCALGLSVGALRLAEVSPQGVRPGSGQHRSPTRASGSAA